MPLQKGFLQSKVLRKISAVEYLVGAILGMGFSFSLYALQYVARELFRVFSLSEEGDLWIFTEAEVDFYNLVFAFISVIFGQSICIGYWFDRPSKTFKANKTRIKDIVNEQRFLNWYFVAWFSKVALAYAAIFGFAGSGWFYLNSFYPDYNYLFILIVIVLFLQTWNTLLRTFRRKAYRWMACSAIIIILVSFGMSKIQIIDYQNLNKVLTSKRADVKYKLELPSANFSDTLIRRFPKLPTISLVLSKDVETQNKPPVLLVGNRNSSFDELPDIVLSRMEKLEEYEKYRSNWFVAIDKDVPMCYVHHLLETLAIVDIPWIRYQMISKDSVLDYRYHMFYEKTSLSFYNQSHYLNDYELRVRQLKKYSNVIRIDITNEDYRLNNQIFNENSLKSEIKRLIQSNADYAVTFNYPEDLSFGKYFGALSAIRGAIRVFRDAESFRLAKKDFDQLRSSFNSSDLEMEIMNKYPLRLLDLSPDLKQMNQAPPNFSPLLKELDEE